MLASSNNRPEKRRFGRRSLACYAWIKVGRHARVPCNIKNISAEGALLEFNGFPPPENRFRLLIDEEGIDVNCDVRHRRGNAIGVYFEMPEVKSPNVEAAGNALVQEIRAWLLAE